ncbi:hypothetical protein B0H16DRAFT_1580004, partial [Mycena metata]
MITLDDPARHLISSDHNTFHRLFTGTFVMTILPILQNTSTSVDDKKTRLGFFTWAMDQNNQNVTDIDALVSVFNNISNDVASFQATFQEKIAQVGRQVGNTTQVWNWNNLAPAIHVAYEDMASLQQKLNVQIQLERAKKSEIREQNGHLSIVKQADDVEITEARNQEIELAAASYANLAQILETFADGWTTT